MHVTAVPLPTVAQALCLHSAAPAAIIAMIAHDVRRSRRRKKKNWVWYGKSLRACGVRCLIDDNLGGGITGKKNYVGRETLPTSIKEKETRWLRRAVSLLHHMHMRLESILKIGE
eukprot:1137120-Pelagomonas_calceolata.AAC.1